MEVRNSAGHRVSLLNDEASSTSAPAASATAKFTAHTTSSSPIGRGVRLPPFSAALAQTSSSLSSSTSTTSTFVHRPRPSNYATHSYSSTRSYGSTSSASSGSSSRSPPDTPPLERSDSRDSSTMNGSLSPPTPTYPEYDAVMGAAEQHSKPIADGHRAAGPYFGNPGQLNVNVPFTAGVAPQEMGQWYSDVTPMSPPFGNPTPGGYPLHATGIPVANPFQQQQPNPGLLAGAPPNVVPFVSAQPLSSPTASNTPDRRSSTTKGKNNKFPCPLAAQFNCSDTFTTSGHAARHAKKHTGKKDAICPECRKAFTRKDNMEQHRRTHKNGKNQPSARAGTAEAESAPSTTTNTISHARKASTASITKPAVAGASALISASPRAARPAPLMDPNAMLAGSLADSYSTFGTHPQIDPALSVSPTSSLGFPPGQYRLPDFAPTPGALAGSSYPDPTGLGVGVGYSPLMGSAVAGFAESPIMAGMVHGGLEALSEAAAAASNSSEEDLTGLKRK